jgi:uncharacterized protein YbjQ (UPF0145 family)
MVIATTERIAGWGTVAGHGLVLGVAVRRRRSGANITAGFQALGNDGALGVLGEGLAAVRQEAVAQLAARAGELGANIVVGVRFDTVEVRHDMVDIVAYGSAVAVASE